MKKLMTMIAAVGMAFGLFADTDSGKVTATSFEGATEFNDDVLVTGGNSGWVEYTADGQLTKGDGNTYSYSNATGNNPRYTEFDETDTASLTIKTTFGNPILRALTNETTETLSVTNVVFFDQLVKFTAFDEAPTTIGADDKIALYVRDWSDDATNPSAKTNLYAVAGNWSEEEGYSEKTYDLGPIADLDAWHRVTIKAIKAQTTSIGFQIFVDTLVREADVAGYAGDSVASLTPEAKSLNALKYILPVKSQAGGTTLAKVGFDGQGSIDDLSVSTTAPFPAAKTQLASITWGDDVEKVAYRVGETGEYTDATEAPITVLYNDGMQIFIKPTCAENRAFAEVEGMTWVVQGDAYMLSPAAPNALLATIVTKDSTPRIKIGSDTYSNFADAIKAIGTLTEGQTVTVELQDDVPASWDEEEGTEATFDAGEGEIIIDLAGNTISGTAEEGTYVVRCIGNVTIMDSVGDGMIAVSENYIGAVRESSGCLKVTGGKIDGAVQIDNNAESLISGGSFKKGEEQEFPLTLAGGYEANDTDESGYWTVKAIPTFTVTFKVDGETYATVDKVVDKVGDRMPENPAKVGYTFTGWTANEAPFTADTIVTADTEVTAQFSVIAYKVLYLDANDETYTNDTATSFTVANYTDLTALWDGDRTDEGWVWDDETGWLDSTMTDAMDLAAVKAAIATMIEAEEVTDVVLYGQWEQASTTVTVTFDCPATMTALAVVQGDVTNEVQGTTAEVTPGVAFSVIYEAANGYVFAGDAKTFTKDYDAVTEATQIAEYPEIAEAAAEIVGGKQFATIAAALEAAQVDDTVKFLKDDAANLTAGISTAAAVIDYNGTSNRLFNAAKQTLTFTGTGTSFTIKNGTDSYYAETRFFKVPAGATLTIENMVFEGQITPQGVADGNNVLVVKDCTFLNLRDKEGNTGLSDKYLSYGVDPSNFARADFTGNTFYQMRRSPISGLTGANEVFVYDNDFIGSRNCLAASERSNNEMYPALQITKGDKWYFENNRFYNEEDFADKTLQGIARVDNADIKAMVISGNEFGCGEKYFWTRYTADVTDNVVYGTNWTNGADSKFNWNKGIKGAGEKDVAPLYDPATNPLALPDDVGSVYAWLHGANAEKPYVVNGTYTNDVSDLQADDVVIVEPTLAKAFAAPAGLALQALDGKVNKFKVIAKPTALTITVALNNVTSVDVKVGEAEAQTKTGTFTLTEVAPNTVITFSNVVADEQYIVDATCAGNLTQTEMAFTVDADLTNPDASITIAGTEAMIVAYTIDGDQVAGRYLLNQWVDAWAKAQDGSHYVKLFQDVVNSTDIGYLSITNTTRIDFNGKRCIVKAATGKPVAIEEVGTKYTTFTPYESLAAAFTAGGSDAKYFVTGKDVDLSTLTLTASALEFTGRFGYGSYNAVVGSFKAGTEPATNGCVATTQWGMVAGTTHDFSFVAEATASEGVAPGGAPVNVEAKDEAEALEKVQQIEVDPPAEAAAAVTKEAYNAYFVKKAAKLENGTFNVYVDLKSEIVQAAKETEALAGKLSEISAAAEGEVDVAITNAKPGLYYSVIEGQQLTGRTEGEKTLATGTSVTIKTTKFANSGFYQINVSASAGLTE